MADGAQEEKVRERAYAIWEREGRPEGQAERHWAQVEEELRAEERGADASAAAPSPDVERVGHRDLLTMGIVLP